jgi:hypothetical protein
MTAPVARWLRRTAAIALGVLLAFSVRPPAAQAVDLPGLPSLNPADWAVEGVQAILKFFFGNSIEKIADVFVNLLLAVPHLSDPKRFPGLNAYHDYVMGAGWGLLALSFIFVCLQYWASSYTSSGAQQAAIGFTRVIGGIGLMLCFPIAFGLTSDAVNELTAGLIKNPYVGDNLGTLIEATFVGGITSGGGLSLLVGIAALVMAIVLLVVKVCITAVLAVLFVLSPLAIGLWPFEPVAWALRSLAQAMLVLLCFPVLWAACFGTFAVLTPAALAPGAAGGLGSALLTSVVGLACLIVAFKLPFAVLRIATGMGLVPSMSRALQTVHYGRGLAGMRA